MYFTFILCSFLAGCDRINQTYLGSATDQTSHQELIDTMQILGEHWNNGDLDAMRPYYAEKIVQMPPNQFPVVGREELFDRWKNYREQFIDNWEPYVETVTISGDIAIVRGGFFQTSFPITGGHGYAMHAKSVQVFERNSKGDWKMTLDIWNTQGRRKLNNRNDSL